MRNEFFYSKRVLIVSTIVFLLFLVVVLPVMSGQMMKIVGDAASPDTSFIYSSSDLYEMARDYGVEGRKVYLVQRATFDVVWPFVYGIFMFSSIGYAIKNNDTLKRFKYLLYVPVIAVGLDFLENLFASIVFYRYPLETDIIAKLTPIATLTKWGFVGIGMILAIVFLLYIGIKFLKRR